MKRSACTVGEIRMSGKASLALLVLGLSACNLDPETTKIQYMPDMADSPATKAQENYLDPPVGAMPLSAPVYPKTVEEAEKALAMPEVIASDPDIEEKGKALFNTFCIPCHGADAKGGGSIISAGFPQPPDITHPTYAARSDGFYFYRITFGSASGVMPSYGHAISVDERWQIVTYLRTLQKASH